MEFSNTKDRILKFLFSKDTKGAMTGEIAINLAIPHSTVVTLCKEMSVKEGDGNAFVFKRATLIDGFYESYVVISHKGKHFTIHKGYKWEWFKRTIVDFPKTFWFITALFAFWAGRDFKCAFSKTDTPKQAQQSQQPVYLIKDTCLHK